MTPLDSARAEVHDLAEHFMTDGAWAASLFDQIITNGHSISKASAYMRARITKPATADAALADEHERVLGTHSMPQAWRRAKTERDFAASVRDRDEAVRQRVRRLREGRRQ